MLSVTFCVRLFGTLPPELASTSKISLLSICQFNFLNQIICADFRKPLTPPPGAVVKRSGTTVPSHVFCGVGLGGIVIAMIRHCRIKPRFGALAEISVDLTACQVKVAHWTKPPAPFKHDYRPVHAFLQKNATLA